MSGIYSQEILLRSKDVDLHRRLRTSLLFELLQEASIRHTEQLGMGREKTLDKGLLWVVGMQYAEINRMPEYDETIVLKSWPGRTMHLFFPRYYSIASPSEEPLVRASAMWMLIDAETRKMVFPEEYGVEIEGVVTGSEIALPQKPKLAVAGEQRAFDVPYSYVDLNGHMNNTRYFDLAEDTIPAAREGKQLRRISMEYVSEARLGDRLCVTWAQDGDDYSVAGAAEKPVFRLRLSYRS